MGAKGSKNVPITARVSTGLFNKNKGVTEPLLNVGPAGVNGNNKTKDIPSPSKIKGYSMKSSPFKQTDSKKVAEEAESLESNRENIKNSATGTIKSTDYLVNKLNKGGYGSNKKSAAANFQQDMNLAAKIQRKADSITMSKSPKQFFDRDASSGNIAIRKKK
tara:strand:- start:3651 stop:4136 length:486 start_codon:yes stop_codon:yes gene_type:complete